MNDTKTLPSDGVLEAKRSVLRGSIEEILSEIEIAVREAGFDYRIGLTVPQSGDAIMTILTTEDPPDQDWSEVTDIACGILSKKLGDMRLRTRPLACAITRTGGDAVDLVRE